MLVVVASLEKTIYNIVRSKTTSVLNYQKEESDLNK
jgi:hypothetical protein